MGKKSAATAASKISATETTGSSDKSSILRSSFAPSSLQLHLFASVIQSFESQQLRIHDTSNGRLRQQHSVPAGTEITCLDWGRYGPSYRELRASNKKKRKRNHESLEDVVVAYGTNKSEICMFSPSQGEIISVLRNGHDREVRDFKFHPVDNLEAWSIGGDSKLVQWDLQSDKVLRTIPLIDSSIQTLSWPSRTLPQIFCASVTPYAVHIESKDDFRIDAFDAFKQPVHSLFRPTESTKEKQDVLIAADNNRFLNVYDVSKKKIVRTLVVGGEIEHASLSQPVAKEDQILAVVTREGIVELFAKPFSLPSVVNGDIKAQRKQMTRRADASVKLVAADGSNKPVSASEAFIDGPNLIVASTEGGVEPVFQKIRWEDEGNGELLFDGVKEVPRAKPASTLNTATMNGAKDMGQVQVNEAKTVVANGLAEPGSQSAPVEIESSDEEEESEEDEDEQDEEMAGEAGSDEASDEEMQDADASREDTTADVNEEGEPSFGDLLAARHPETISIANALAGNDKSLMKLPESKQLMLPSGMSLGTVLQQSLRTNDQSLLETCLHVTDEQIIQNTILRLDSSLAANLLGKLAERLADRPGRYGHLLTWVQSTMIAHGGAIASQAGVASKLRTLYQVLNERSRILPSILLLKGKLDMMKAQQSFRKQATDHRKGVENVETMIYVEGGEDNWSSEEDTDNVPAARKSKKAKKASRKDLDMLIARPESSDDEDIQMVNGGYHMDDDEEHESDEDAPHTRQPNGIVDDEAEVSGEDDDESGGDESDNSDDSEEDDEDDDEEDSSMADFINDGEISVEEDDEDDIDVDEEPARPAKKKSKHR